MSSNLSRFQRPSRYIGNEVNIIRKSTDVQPVKKAGESFPYSGVKIALCFPDTYEIGMSHQGLKILYSIINSLSSASAERVFAPWIDYESFLREKGIPLSSLENNLPLKDFEIIGFTLQYELSYTNVLNMIDLGGIPVKACDRNDSHPLIIAGGPCAVNPLPLIPFIDAFVIGDGEEVIEEIIETYKNFKMQIEKCKLKNKGQVSKIGNKNNLLKALSELEGVYVPSVHDINKDKISKRIVKNLDKAPYPVMPVVPFASIVHDRVAIEISRGCSKGCRFCQAGMIYRPLRERSLEKVLSLAQNSISNTGHEEISFTSLSAGDYSKLIPLIINFNNLCSESNIAVSLPSLRVDTINRDLLKAIKSVRKTGFTIAPEAATQRLRNIINKDFTEEELKNTLETLFEEGWQNIKLYFMIGLPTETMEDINEIINLAESTLKKGRKLAGKRVNINVGISAFVPKSHTPFQWLGQTSYQDLRTRQDFIRNSFKRKGINFKGQHIETSLLEAVFARGDTGCARLLETAWRDGCRFDGWSEVFDFNKWLKAAEKTGIDLYKYASRKMDLHSKLPWDFVDIGVSREFLKTEYQKALNGDTTPDCRHACYGCGLDCKDRSEIADRGMRNEELKNPKSEIRNSQPLKTAITVKIRVKFSKTGTMRYLSHRELSTTLLRAMRRAKVPLIYSGGFHPHPKISFGPALPVGIEGANEYFDIELPDSFNISYLTKAVNATLPEGLRILTAVHITKKGKSLDDFISRYEYKIHIDKTIQSSINSFLSNQELLVKRNGKTVDIRPMIEKVEVNNVYLNLILTDNNGTKVRLYEILKELLQKPVEEIQAMPIKRIQMYGQSRKGWINPLESEEICQMK